MTTVEYDLKELFAKFESRFDKLENKLDVVHNDLNEVKVKLAKLEKIEQDVTELKTTQKNQLWAIISLFGISVIATVIRFVFEGFPNIAQ